MADTTRDFLHHLATTATKDLTQEDLRKAVAVGEAAGIRLEKADDGAMMIAWYLPADLAQALVGPLQSLPGCEAPEDLHLTIAYIPSSEIANPAVIDAVTCLEATHHACLDGVISGTGRFVLDEDPNGTDAFFCTVDVPGLGDMRDCIIDSLQRAGVWPDTYSHGFTPHITLAYINRQDDYPAWLEQQVPVCVDSLSFASQAGDRADYDLISYDYEGDVESEDQLAALSSSEPTVMAFAKATAGDEEMRYSLGVVYAPGRVDAHGEWADDDLLHKAFIDYARNAPAGGHRTRAMHDDQIETGTVVELMRWPYEHEIEVQVPGGELRKMTMPAGTVYMGVIWDEWAWDALKKGKLGGLSMGGAAMRIASDDDLDHMGDHFHKRMGSHE